VRPALGEHLQERLAIPLGLGGEARGELGYDLWSALELTRQYSAGDTAGLYAERPVWQVTAWFGWTRSTD
jgi:hypothetical protein